MLILTTPEEMHSWVRNIAGQSTRGFIPTMGALHRGHEALLQNSLAENDTTVLSIFVNPTQFNVPSDYENYPSTTARDLALAEHHGVDVVFMPSATRMYPEDFGSFIKPGGTALHMEGEHRPGHFQGVTTIVAKLFNMVQPHRAYFGKKDFQQLAVVRQMVSELNYPIEIVGLDTVREEDGLALSSRNQRLTSTHRKDASIIFQGLSKCQVLATSSHCSSLDLIREFTQHLSCSEFASIEYATVCDGTTLQKLETPTPNSVLCVAVWYDNVRLIDNIELRL
jgi:pantoate--beta-alanine ligase